MRPLEKRLSPPKVCNVCTLGKVTLRQNDELARLEYVCTNCDAKVGCHKGTTEPLGVLAHSEVRKLRVIAHHYFDRIWKERHFKRQEAYNWLADKLSISVVDCHFSQLDEWQLERAIHICQKFLRPESLIRLKRERKRNARLTRQRERTKSIVNRRKSN